MPKTYAQFVETWDKNMTETILTKMYAAYLQGYAEAKETSSIQYIPAVPTTTPDYPIYPMSPITWCNTGEKK